MALSFVPAWAAWLLTLAVLGAVVRFALLRRWEAVAQQRLAALRTRLLKVKVHRVWAVGSSGAGKTYFTQEVGKALHSEAIDLDDYFWGENWRRIPTEEVLERLAPQLQPGARWAVAGNYHEEVGHALLPLATAMVWIHPSRWQIMRQIIWRSMLRALRLSSEPYCAGNQESPYTVFCTRRSLIYRTWKKIEAVEARYGQFLEQRPAGLKGAVIELAGRREVAEFLLHCLRKSSGEQEALALAERRQRRAKALKLATAVWKASFRHARKNTTKKAEKKAKRSGASTTRSGMRRNLSRTNLHKAGLNASRQRHARRK